MEPTPRGLRRAAEPVRRTMFYAPTQSCWLRRHFRRALGTGRADGKLKLFLRPRARFEIQTDMQTEPEKPKTVGAELPSSSLTVLFHVKQCAKNLAVLHLRGVRPSDPDTQKRDNADCATESPPQGHGTCPVHVSTARTETARGKRHVPPVMSESATAREDRPIHRLQARAPIADSFSPKYNPKSRTAHPPMQTIPHPRPLLTPNSTNH